MRKAVLPRRGLSSLATWNRSRTRSGAAFTLAVLYNRYAPRALDHLHGPIQHKTCHARADSTSPPTIVQQAVRRQTSFSSAAASPQQAKRPPALQLQRWSITMRNSAGPAERRFGRCRK